jgi:hypothetical protein
MRPGGIAARSKIVIAGLMLRQAAVSVTETGQLSREKGSPKNALANVLRVGFNYSPIKNKIRRGEYGVGNAGGTLRRALSDSTSRSQETSRSQDVGLSQSTPD